jgi:5-methyltetrahydrofolate--homocysteine methyltransferase
MLSMIFQSILEGDAKKAAAGVEQALEAGIDPGDILNQGMIPAMAEVGRLFEVQEYYIPEMLISARAMQGGLAILKPYLVDSDVKPTGKVVLGTVKGDLHDIGKNLVGMMLEGTGFEVVDLGTDVSAEQFVAAVKEHQPEFVGMSALLTTTMPGMITTIDALTEAGVRDRVKVMVGGAPLTPQFAEQIGADVYAPDASSAAKQAKLLLQTRAI